MLYIAPRRAHSRDVTKSIIININIIIIIIIIVTIITLIIIIKIITSIALIAIIIVNTSIMFYNCDTTLLILIVKRYSIKNIVRY